MQEDYKLFSKLISQISKYNESSNTEFIKKAYKFAKNAHKSQKRKSWEPYIIHPIHAALNLTRIEADDVSIVSALLHDVPEDTRFTIEDIYREFWEEVWIIVDWVTKLSKVQYTSDMNKREVDSLKKLFITVSKDLRTIVVKICDRLHNLHTLEALPFEKRYRIAKESLEVYVPTLKLLSIWEFMWEMEDLCFRYLHEEDYYRLYNSIGRKYDYYTDIIWNAHDKILKVAWSLDLELNINWRVKSLYSIYTNMKIKDLSIEDVHDIVALRVITKNEIDCYRALWVIHKIFKIREDRFKDYISSPKNNWYQSIHTTVFNMDGDLIEFQIQSKQMYDLNKFGIASHFVYKSFDSSYTEAPEWIKKILDLQRKSLDAWSFVDVLKSQVLWDMISCYTPKWKQIDLPKDSTLLDFAFRIHSDFWKYFQWAFINWVYVDNPVYILRNWDFVKLLRKEKENSNFSVNHIWLLKTDLARENFKKLIKKDSKEKIIKLGKYMLNSNLDLIWLWSYKSILLDYRKKIEKKFWIKDKEDLFYNIWNWSLELAKVLKHITLLHKKKVDKLKVVSIKVNLKMSSFDTVADILSLLRNYDLELTKVCYRRKYIIINFKIYDISSLQDLYNEINRVPNILNYKRIYNLRVYIFYVLYFLVIIDLLFSIPAFIFYFYNYWFNSTYFNFSLIFDLLMLFTIVKYFSYLKSKSLFGIISSKKFYISAYIFNTILLLYFLSSIILFPLSNFNFVYLIFIFLLYFFIYFTYLKKLWKSPLSKQK